MKNESIDWNAPDEEDGDGVEFNLNAQNGVEIENEKHYMYSFTCNGKFYNFSIFTKHEHPHANPAFFTFYLTSFIEVKKNEKLMPIDVSVAHLPIETSCSAKNFEQAECILFEVAWNSITQDGVNFAVNKAYQRESLFVRNNMRKFNGINLDNFIVNQDMKGFIKSVSVEYQKQNEEEVSKKVVAVLEHNLIKAFGKATKAYNDSVLRMKPKKLEVGQASFGF